MDIHSRISVLPSSSQVGQFWEAKINFDGEVSLTLGSTIEDSLACCKFPSNRSTPEFRHLPAGDEGDGTMKYPASELGMSGILVAPLVLHVVHVRLVEVLGFVACYV